MRPILWYLAFVGLPFVALLGILRVGEQLRPPRAVHGRYAVSFDSSGAGPCVSALVDSTEQQLMISQSGPRLEMSFGRMAFTGSIAADTVRAATVIDDKATLRASNCLPADAVAIVAAIEATADHIRLPGTLSFPGCASCSPVRFRATRIAVRTRDAGA
ncbi:MAG: hypothetical protein ACT4P6_18145 [Gemmatimonadaceae bacterium]